MSSAEDGQILCLSAPNAYTLSQYLARISIFSEDAEMKGKIVSWQESIRFKPYAYLGHNIPGKIVSEFFNLVNVDSLNDSEKHLLEQIVNLNLISFEPGCSVLLVEFYLIGYIENDSSSKKHELSHAYYNLNQSYRNSVQQLYDSLSRKELAKVNACLELRGYSSDLYTDEFGAYLLEGDKELLKICPSIKQSTLDAQIAQFSNLLQYLQCNKLIKPLPQSLLKQKQRKNKG
jgi:hypothetical protein